MTTAEDLHHHLVHRVFAAAIAGDAGLRDAVEGHGGGVRFDGRDLLFTLPQLLRFVLQHCESSGHSPPDAQARDYRVFRRLLYGSQTNSTLRGFGAVVVLERAADDQTLSVYRLTRVGG
jgi:hypothetical protein